MTYLCWAAMYEGNSDADYFNVLIPRLMEEIALSGHRTPTIPLSPAVPIGRNSVEISAKYICENASAFHIVFIHADTGGRGLEENIYGHSCAYCDAISEMCNFDRDRCVVIAPRHETEAWILGDANAVVQSLGYTGPPENLGLPPNPAAAERLTDPKAVFNSAVNQVRGRQARRRAHPGYAAVAQRQDFGSLRQMPSFREFEDRLTVAMRSLGCG